MKLSHGAEIEIDTVTFDGNEATVSWWWLRDCEGRDVDDGKVHTATFSWRDAGSVSMTSGGCGPSYDIEQMGHTGDEPKHEVWAYLEDKVLAAIPRHLRDLAAQQ